MDPQKEKEREAFEAFLRAYPSLASDIAGHWNVQDEAGAFPDVLATLKDGSKIGFELGEWLVEDEIAQGKRQEQLDSSIRETIGQQSDNKTKHIHSVLLAPKKECTRCDGHDRQSFREELLKLIEETDSHWPTERHDKDFSGLPTLGKYLGKVRFISRVKGMVTRQPKGPGMPWINVKSRGGSYSGESARAALQTIILKKAGHYGNIVRQPVSLLIHYGADALTYNAPFMDEITSRFQDVAKLASGIVGACSRRRQLPFDKVYLGNTLPFEQEAYEIFPELWRCK
ncbi:MAG: hypothetical protein AB7G48_17850 [Nitrospiraceae bacterium]